jgi:hypothetical protein
MIVSKLYARDFTSCYQNSCSAQKLMTEQINSQVLSNEHMLVTVTHAPFTNQEVTG